MAPKESIGEAVLARLAELRKNQAWLAPPSGMGTSVLSRLLRGERRLSVQHLLAIGQALGIELTSAIIPSTQGDVRIAALHGEVAQLQDSVRALRREIAEERAASLRATYAAERLSSVLARASEALKQGSNANA